LGRKRCGLFRVSGENIVNDLGRGGGGRQGGEVSFSGQLTAPGRGGKMVTQGLVKRGAFELGCSNNPSGEEKNDKT